MKKKRYLYQYGGQIPLDSIYRLGSQAFDVNSFSQQGRPNVGNMTASSALSGAATGFAAGNMVFPGIGGIVGGVGGAVIGGLTGNAKARKAEAAFDLQRRRMDAVQNRLESDRLASFMQIYGNKGQDRTTLFRNGGDILGAVGGYLKPIAPGTKKAVGRSHKQGGIDLSITGNREVEVEGGEIMHRDRQVFSDKLKIGKSGRTYADAAEAIARTPDYIRIAKKQQKLETVASDPKKNKYQIGTATRQLQYLVNPLDNLFAMQEAAKIKAGIQPNKVRAEYGTYIDPYLSNPTMWGIGMFANARNQGMNPTPADRTIQSPFTLPSNPVTTGSPPAGAGAAPIVGQRSAGFSFPKISANDLNRGIGAVSPFIDNMVNAAITRRTPPIPSPTYLRAPSIETKFNIDPQLYEINRAAAARNSLLTRNSSNPQVSRANILAGTASDISARNQLMGQQRNIETELRNKQQMLNYENQAANASKIDNYRFMNMQRVDDIHRRQSMNAANLTEDLMFRNRDVQMGIRDKQQLALIAAQYADSGVIERAALPEIMTAIESGASMADIEKIVENKRKQLAEKKKAAGK